MKDATPFARDKCASATSAALFVLFFGTFAYFHHAEPGWNVNSRLALTFAIVERGTVRIDAYSEQPEILTDDVAVFNGHVYSDKAVGVSLLAVPGFAAVRAVEAARGGPFDTSVRRYWVTLLSVGLAAAAAGAVLFRLLLRFGRRWAAPEWFSPRGCRISRGRGDVGTLLFFFSTLLMAYLPATLALLLALERFEVWSDASALGKCRECGIRTTESAEVVASPAPPWFLIGLLLGLAMMCDLFYVPAAAGVAIYAFAVTGRWRDWWRLTLGAAAGLAPYAAYLLAVFGTLSIPYQYERNLLFREMMARGFMGAGWPNPAALWLLTFHPFRGLFVHSPFLLMALPACVVLARRDATRVFSVLCVGIAAFYLLFNSGYYMWWGGWSFGPRHLAPAIPFLVLPLAALWGWRPARWALVGTVLVAVAVHLVVVSVDPQPRDLTASIPLTALLSPDLRRPYAWVFLARTLPAFLHGDASAGAGRFAGLTGPLAVGPLVVFWAAIAVRIACVVRRTESKAGGCGATRDEASGQL